MSLPDLRGLFATLAAARVEFVVIGGVALGIHGLIRATEDLDIVPNPATANLDRLCHMLQVEQATLLLKPSRRFGAREAWMLRRGRNVSLSTRHGDLDIVRNLPGVPDYDTLVAQAQRYSVDDLPIAVASPASLTDMKRARGSTQDQADIDSLGTLGALRSDSRTEPG